MRLIRVFCLLTCYASGTAWAQQAPDGGTAPPPGDAGEPPAPSPAVTQPTPPLPLSAPPPPDKHEKKDKPIPVEFFAKPGKGFTFSAGDFFSMTLRGRMMLRYSGFYHDGYTQEFTIRRARIYLSGHTFSRNIQYVFHVAFASQDYDRDNPTLSQLYDAYLQLTHLRDMHVRIGQQLVPFNRSRVISSQNAELVDRSIVNAEINLDRDLGIKLFSSDVGGLGHKIGYEIFVGIGEGRNLTAVSNYGLLYVARLQFNPMGKFEDYTESDLEHTPTPKLSIGLAGAFNQASLRNRSTLGPRYVLGDFDYAYGVLDLLFKVRGFSFMAEGMVRWSPKFAIDGFDEKMLPKTEYSRRAGGYFVQAGYVAPRPKIGVALRWSHLMSLELENDPALLKLIAEQGKEIIGGLSWYMHGHILKIQGDYAYLFGDDITTGRHQVRVQLHVGY